MILATVTQGYPAPATTVVNTIVAGGSVSSLNVAQPQILTIVTETSVGVLPQ